MSDEEVFEGAIGIDLGTTYSCVAAFVKDKVEIIPNAQGNRTTPSYVAFTETERLVGDPARNQIAKNPRNTVYDAKRLIGRKFSDKEVQNDLQTWPFKVIAGEHDAPFFEVEHRGETQRLRPEQISGLILSALKETAENYLGKKVKKAVITVPAYFNDAQRTSTKVAGELAGLEVARIINEPTAAALAYGLDRKGDAGNAQLVLVFDLGGGTFDASLIAMEGSVFEVRATSGNTHLGGQDFDDNLVKFCIQEFKKSTKLDLSSNPKAVRKLRTAVEKGKRALSSSMVTEIEVDAIHEGHDLLVKVSRAKFEQLNMKLFEACIKEIEKVLLDAKVKPSDVDEVVMVGGSSRIPKVQEMVAEFFGGKRLNYSINPDEAIAFGAAIQGNVLAGSEEAKAQTGDLLLLDVAPLSIGLAADGGKLKILIPRNSTIPRKVTEEFTTVDDNQTVVEVEVYEGERARASANHLLGTFELDDIREAPAGEPSIMVTFSVDANGVLNVTAEDTSSPGGKTAKITINNTNKLSSDEIKSMVEEAQKFAREDKAFVKLTDAKARYEQYLYDLLTLAEDKNAKESLAKALQAQEEWQEENLETASYDDIQEKLDQLIEIHRRLLETKEERAKRKREEEQGEGSDDELSQELLKAISDDGHSDVDEGDKPKKSKRTKKEDKKDRTPKERDEHKEPKKTKVVKEQSDDEEPPEKGTSAETHDLEGNGAAAEDDAIMHQPEDGSVKEGGQQEVDVKMKADLDEEKKKEGVKQEKVKKEKPQKEKKEKPEKEKKEKPEKEKKEKPEKEKKEKTVKPKKKAEHPTSASDEHPEPEVNEGMDDEEKKDDGDTVGQPRASDAGSDDKPAKKPRVAKPKGRKKEIEVEDDQA